MKKIFPSWFKLLSALFIFLSSFSVSNLIFSAASSMKHAGVEMSHLLSKGGNSLAEHYYRLHGEIYASLSLAIEGCALLVFCIGIVTTSWLVCSAVITIKKEKEFLKKNIPHNTLLNKGEQNENLY